MSTLSIRLDPELEHQLDLEVARRRTTRSRYVQEVLRASLMPQNPLHLLQEARAEYGLPDPAATTRPTRKAGQAKALAKKAVAAKLGKSGPATPRGRA